VIVLGVAIFAAGVRNFSRAATPVPSTRPVRRLVTSGIHGLRRNPTYFGVFYADWSASQTGAARARHTTIRCAFCGSGKGGRLVDAIPKTKQGDPRPPLPV
jgi:hypothetical protein